MAVTWQNVKDLFYETIGDREADGHFFATATVTDFANDAIYEASHRTRYCDYYEAGTTVAGTALVAVTAGRHVQVWRVEVDDEKMIPITTDEIRRRDRYWASRTGTPRFYMLDEYQLVGDVPLIRLFETPNTTGTAVKIYAYGPQYIITDASPTQNINVPEWFAYALLFGMLCRAYEADTEMQSFEKAEFYRMLWEDAMGRLRGRSFSRLAKRWEFKPQGKKRGLDIRNRIPEHIPEPS